MKKISINLKPESIPYETIVKTLRAGGLVIVPSDTVYGLLVDANNEKAVDKLIRFKNRPSGKPISVFVPGFAKLEEYVHLDLKQTSLLERILPGPFTIILKSKHNVSKYLESEKGTLGIRLPNYDFITHLVSQYGSALTATSANLSGKSPVYRIDALLKTLSQSKLDLIDLIVDVGALPRNKPSTIIDLTKDELKLVRQGDLVLKDTQRFISESPEQTKKISQFIFNKILGVNKNAVVVILEGEMGVGKTIFVKGIGEALGVQDIISPTFVIYYEYVLKEQNFKKLYHLDLYQISEKEEFRYLGIKKLLEPGNILCFEWGEKVGELFEVLKKKAKVVYVKMKYIDEKKREISWSTIN